MSRPRDDHRGPRWPRDSSRERDRDGDVYMGRNDVLPKNSDSYSPSNNTPRKDYDREREREHDRERQRERNDVIPTQPRRDLLPSNPNINSNPAKEPSTSEIENKSYPLPAPPLFRQHFQITDTQRSGVREWE